LRAGTSWLGPPGGTGPNRTPGPLTHRPPPFAIKLLFPPVRWVLLASGCLLPSGSHSPLEVFVEVSPRFCPPWTPLLIGWFEPEPKCAPLSADQCFQPLFLPPLMHPLKIFPFPLIRFVCFFSFSCFSGAFPPPLPVG